MDNRYKKRKRNNKKRNNKRSTEQSGNHLSQEQLNELIDVRDQLENEKIILEETREIMDMSEEIMNSMLMFREQMIMDLYNNDDDENSNESESSDDSREYDISDDDVNVVQTNNDMNNHEIFYNVNRENENEESVKPLISVNTELNKHFRYSLMQMIDLDFMSGNDRENFKKCIEIDHDQQCNVQKRKRTRENKISGKNKAERFKNGWIIVLNKFSILEDKVNKVLKLAKYDLSNYSEVTLNSIKICIEKKKLCKKIYDELSVFFN